MPGAIDQNRLVSSASQGGGHWFEPIAEHLGAAYLRYSFTKGTEQEVAFLVDALGLHAGDESQHTFDPDLGVDHERTEVRDEAGRALTVDLWTTCYTPRELRLLASSAGLVVENVWSVEPGAYAANAVDLDHAELLLVARRPV